MAVENAAGLFYMEVLLEQRQWVTGFPVRALRYLRSIGTQVERMMIDDGPGYIYRLIRKGRRMLQMRRIRTRPDTLKRNGKTEQIIIQTLLRQ